MEEHVQAKVASPVGINGDTMEVSEERGRVTADEQAQTSAQ